MGCRRDVEIVEFQAILAGNCGWLGSEARRVKHPIEDLARPVAGEHAAGAVGTVRAGRESKNQDPRACIAEGGHGAAPVDLIPVGPALELRDFRRMRAQAGAAPAFDDLLSEDI